MFITEKKYAPTVKYIFFKITTFFGKGQVWSFFKKNFLCVKIERNIRIFELLDLKLSASDIFS